ncbi:ABC transporter permease [Amphibacillus sp. MSJ-3]|uniref:ABC transporter permease n=1 Tax=Amphibacillus sp. MSJ-3 TaxID=2841505 RepID=UPI001C0EF713|nr:ABC transporter permease [Amphibacillus sp. MSJ-3]MBU5595578.1 ABC transporter permease [Amphibacillus sp. MSJ-3]
MTFRRFVINNVVGNKRIYAAYFLSSMFTVIVFFTFAMFAFHPVFSQGDINEYALFGMGVAGGIIYVFSFFFVLYSMGSFLQSRKKEFGLLMLQGMTMRQIRFMVFLENMFIGIFATVIGILLGTVFSKFILLIAENILVIEESLYFYFPLWAMVISFGSFMLLFLVISFFVTFVLRSKKLAELIKANQQPKKEPKASKLLTFLAVSLIAIGYVTAIRVEGVEVIAAMIPVIIVVTIGTYFLFTQLSVFLINLLKKRKKFFWKKTNMILLSDLSYRMKDNARTFFMVAIISTVAFSAIGTLFGLQSYLTSGLKVANPYSFTYYEDDEQTNEEIERDLQTVNQLLEKNQLEAEQVSVTLQYFETVDEELIFIASESMYNEFAQLLNRNLLQLEENEIVGVRQSAAIIGGYVDDPLIDQPIELESGLSLVLKDVVDGDVLPVTDVHYVVSDEVYQRLPDPVRTEGKTVWNVTDGKEADVIEVGEQLTEALNVQSSYHFQALDYMIYTVNKSYGPILFIGLFIGIVFFVSAGSFLYFRLFTDLDQDKEKFAAIAKIGLTNKELKKVITRQTAILFFAPIVLAIIHGAVALTALSHLFDYNLVKESTVVLSSFFIIQMVYFLIVRVSYIKQIKRFYNI